MSSCGGHYRRRGGLAVVKDASLAQCLQRLLVLNALWLAPTQSVLRILDNIGPLAKWQLENSSRRVCQTKSRRLQWYNAAAQ